MLNTNAPLSIKVLLALFFMSLTLYLRESILFEYAYMFTKDEPSLLSTIYLMGVLMSSFLIRLIAKRDQFKKSRVFKTYFCFLALLILIAFIHLPFVKVSARSIYIGFICYLTTFYSFYILSRYDNIDTYIRKLLLISFMVLAVTYFMTYQNLGFVSAILLSLNSSYILLFLFPIISFLSGRKVQIAVTIIIIVAILLSNKRGGVLAGTIGIMFYYFVEYLFGKGNRQNKTKQLFILVSIIAIFYFVVSNILSSDNNIMVERIMKLQNDEGSGRIEIWQDVWEGIKSSSFFASLFGHGADSVRSITADHDTAHNDYLELIYDYGIIVFMCFLWLIFQIYIYSVKLMKVSSKNAAPLFSLLFMMVSMSIVSHTVIYPTIMIIITMTYGYLLGKNDLKIVNKK